MKRNLAISLMAALTLCGCQNMELDEQVPVQKIFTATIEDGDLNTKTSLDEYGNVLWKAGDQVSIYAGSTINEQYQVTDASDGQTSASLNPVSSPGFSAGGEIPNNVAFYPYSSSNVIAQGATGYVVNTALPSVQNYADASFGNGAFPMAAVTSSTNDMNLKFKNVLGCLKLQLKGTASIASISVTGNNDEVLCGAAAVTLSTTSTPTINLTDASAKTVTLDCGSGVQLNESTATAFVIALPPMTMTGGFTVVVTDTEGKEMEIKTTKSQTITRSSILRMPEVTFVGAGPIDYSTEPLTIKSVGNTSITIWKSSSTGELFIEYRKNAGIWNTYSMHTSIELTDGETLQFRAGEGGNSFFGDQYGNTRFNVQGDGKIVVSGNVMSLLDKTLSRNDMPQHSFHGLFMSCKQLIDASNLHLPAGILSNNCYDSMFSYCSNLTTAPELPATTLADSCYREMFDGCTSLTTAPALPATALANNCYQQMFRGCNSLTTAPELPATTMADFCYQSMFNGCTRLATAPELPATNLALQCYTDMFSYCTSLTTAPTLPATIMAVSCYAGMFSNCTSLATAPVLPATALADYCYFEMFEGCTRLATAPVLPATTLTDSCYREMFYGCTSLATAPVLPATTLTDSCYREMFYGCTSLTTAPALPATTLVNYCYYQMFYGCTNLNYVKALFRTIPWAITAPTGSWLRNVSSTGTFIKSSEATWTDSGASGVPSGWTVLTE